MYPPDLPSTDRFLVTSVWVISADDRDMKHVHLLDRHPYPQQVLFHNLIFLFE